MAIGTPVLGTVDARSTASGTSTPSFPAGISAGDLLVLFGVSGSTSAATFTDPTGFTQQAEISNTGNTAAPNVYLATKTATGSESGTLSCSHSSVVTTMGIILIPGADSTTPLDIAVVTEDKTVASTTISFPSQTVATTGALGLYVVTGNSTTITATPASTQGGWTELYDRSVASTRSCEVAYVAGLSAGATGAITAAPGWSGSTKDVGVLIFARPAGATNVNADVAVGLTDTVTSAAQVGANGSSTVSLTDTVTSTATVGVVASAAIAITAAITATAVVGTGSGSSVTETAAVSSAAQVGVGSGSSVGLTAAITSSASVSGSSLSGSVSIPLADSIASTAVVGKATGAAVSEAVGVSSAATVGKVAGASLSETTAVTSAATVGKVAAASLTPTFVVTPVGVVGVNAGASVGVTFAVSASATVGGAETPLTPADVEVTLTAAVLPRTFTSATLGRTFTALTLPRTLAAGTQTHTVTAATYDRVIQEV